MKRAKKINPESFVVIIGCYAQLKPQEIAKMEGVDMVLGANEKFNLIENIDSFDQTGSNATTTTHDHFSFAIGAGLFGIFLPFTGWTSIISIASRITKSTG